MKPRALLTQQIHEIIMLANYLVGGREVEYNLCTGKRERRAGGRGGPEVFTKLNAYSCATEIEEQVGAKGGFATVGSDKGAGHTGARRKPALLVELAIVGHIGLWHHAGYPPIINQHGTVIKKVAVNNGGAYGHKHLLSFSSRSYLIERPVGISQQSALMKQV